MAEKGTFREDLLYRLRTLNLELSRSGIAGKISRT